jgi:hypothetical protein
MEPPSQADRWEERGCQAAPLLEHVSAAVVVGANPDRAARVALGIARTESGRRRVALGDLVGDLAPLYRAAGGADAFGLSDCFREGLPLSDVARPSPDCETLFILPAGTPPVATYDVLAHERWPRLIRGFASGGALLLLVAALDAPGLDVLVEAAGGIVAVDTPRHRVRRYAVLATIDEPERPPAPRQKHYGRKILLALAAAAVLVSGAFAVRLIRRGYLGAESRVAQPAAEVAPAHDTPASTLPGPVARTDTVLLGAVVNPGDSASAAKYAVELVAANSAASANSVMRDGADAASALDRKTAAVVPVQLGGAAIWYKAVVGAWHDRAAADSLLDALRARGIVRRNAGVVVRVPYALLLADGVPQVRADSVVSMWRGRGVAAYALVQDDGSARVFAGAFETPAQAAPLAATIRDQGVPPQLAFRTGRPF